MSTTANSKALAHEIGMLDSLVTEMIRIRNEVLPAWNSLLINRNHLERDGDRASERDIDAMIATYDGFLATLEGLRTEGLKVRPHDSSAYTTRECRHLDTMVELARTERDELLQRRRFFPSSAAPATPAPPTEPIAA